ncbi:hypothetical protein [Candidatus Ruminimicrobiellum ovillum]|uniref:hypothetical protein n=1 Tax=Candidatus Ruminimicrobiellum ovillum TaxID=1947927 RepID=UPI00355A9D40
MIDAEQKENIITDEDNKIWDTISGIGLVIDDDLDIPVEQRGNKEISKIIDILKKQNIPLIEYGKIPNDDELKNLRGISFVILDWKLIDLGEEQKKKGVTISQEGPNDELNIKFLEKIKKTFLLPVFILTNENVEYIKTKLKDLIEENKPQFIFVKKKNSLLGQEELKKCMIEWVKSSSPIYMLELLEEKINSAKRDTFSMFYNMSPNWVNILYQQAIDDKIDPVQDIFETIIRNIENRIVPLKLNNAIQKKIESDSASITDDETLKQEKFNVSNGRIMIKSNYIKEDIMDLGYLFYKEDENKYYLNVTPTCDNVNRGIGTTKKLFLMIEGMALSDCAILSRINLLKNKFAKRAKIIGRDGKEIILTRNFVFEDFLKNIQVKSYFLAHIIKDNLIKFDFTTLNSIEQTTLSANGYKLIGKILPPFITDIQLHLSQYLIRQGLPRLPIP